MSSQGKERPAQEQVFESDGFEAALFFARHRTAIIVGGAALAAVLALVVTFFWGARGSRLAAEALFAEAGGIEAWREVVARYPRSAPAAGASFLLAKALRERGEIEEANAMYRKIIEGFPNYPLTAGAKIGIAENQLLAGKTEEAVASLREAQSGNTYASPFASLLEGRLLVRQGRLAEARRVLASLVAAYPGSPAAEIAGAQLEQLATVLPPETSKPDASQ